MLARGLDQRGDAEAGAGSEDDARAVAPVRERADLPRPVGGNGRQRQRLRLEIVEQQPAFEFQLARDLAPVDVPGRVGELQLAVDDRPRAAGDDRARPGGEFWQRRFDGFGEAGIVAGVDMHGLRQRGVGLFLDGEARVGAADVGNEDGEGEAHGGI